MINIAMSKERGNIDGIKQWRGCDVTQETMNNVVRLLCNVDKIVSKVQLKSS